MRFEVLTAVTVKTWPDRYGRTFWRNLLSPCFLRESDFLPWRWRQQVPAKSFSFKRETVAYETSVHTCQSKRRHRFIYRFCSLSKITTTTTTTTAAPYVIVCITVFVFRGILGIFVTLFKNVLGDLDFVICVVPKCGKEYLLNILVLFNQQASVI